MHENVVLEKKKYLTNEEKANKLSVLCKELGNPINFIDFGSEISNTQLEIRHDLKGKIKEEDINFIKHAINSFYSFVNSPIFTDSFHEDGSSREEWKDDNLNKIDEELVKFYKLNRLRINVCSVVIEYLKMIIEENLIGDTKTMNSLENLFASIPIKFLERHKNEDSVSVLDYFSSSDEEKIDLIKKLSNVISNVLGVLIKK